MLFLFHIFEALLFCFRFENLLICPTCLDFKPFFIYPISISLANHIHNSKYVVFAFWEFIFQHFIIAFFCRILPIHQSFSIFSLLIIKSNITIILMISSSAGPTNALSSSPSSASIDYPFIYLHNEIVKYFQQRDRELAQSRREWAERLKKSVPTETAQLLAGPDGTLMSGRMFSQVRPPFF